MNLEQAALMHVRVGVLGTVVGVGVLMFQVVVVVRVVRMGVCHVAMVMGVRVGSGMRVLLSHQLVPSVFRSGSLSVSSACTFTSSR